jgi:ArsR family transcriptional regulator
MKEVTEETTGGTAASGHMGESSAVKDLSMVFKALSDETRLRILKLLEGGELCVCHVVAAFGMSQSKVSFHLGVLKAAGLLKDRKDGKWMHYRIDDSDLFRRLLILSVIEKIPGEIIEDDRKRLGNFIDSCAGTVPASGWCCSGKK